MTTATVDGSVLTAVLATLTTILMVGLGFLYRPSPATLLWSIMFLVLMFASYGVLIAEANRMPILGELSEGMMMSAPAFVWSGLRAARGVRPHGWSGPLVATFSAAVLMVSVGHPPHSLVYSVAYFIGAIWAGLTVIELIRRHERDMGRLLPLLVVSGLLPIIGTASIVAAVVGFLSGNEQHVLPDLKSIGVVAYLTCALITLLAIARNPDESRGRSGAGEAFWDTARDRLTRAEAAGETSWCLVALSLDDTDALRAAGGDDAFRRIVARLGSDVRAAFPAEADIFGDGSGSFLVLVARPDSALRDCIRDLLDRVSTVRADQPLAVEFSASVGSACARTHGYDLDTLIAAAHSAMDKARAEGGHQWARAGAV
jgi:GGDEF domain-containing protein